MVIPQKEAGVAREKTLIPEPSRAPPLVPARRDVLDSRHNLDPGWEREEYAGDGPTEKGARRLRGALGYDLQKFALEPRPEGPPAADCVGGAG